MGMFDWLPWRAAQIEMEKFEQDWKEMFYKSRANKTYTQEQVDSLRAYRSFKANCLGRMSYSVDGVNPIEPIIAMAMIHVSTHNYCSLYDHFMSAMHSLWHNGKITTAQLEKGLSGLYLVSVDSDEPFKVINHGDCESLLIALDKAQKLIAADKLDHDEFVNIAELGPHLIGWDSTGMMLEPKEASTNE